MHEHLYLKTLINKQIRSFSIEATIYMVSNRSIIGMIEFIIYTEIYLNFIPIETI